MAKSGTLEALESRIEPVPQEFARPAHVQAYALTDLGNGERLAAKFGASLRYETASKRWYHWDGTRWTQDDCLRVEEYAEQTARCICSEAGDEESHDRRGDLIEHARRTEARSRQQAMIASAQHLLPITPGEWDRDPWLFDVLNGTLDLHWGELRSHDRDDLITLLAPVEYDPQAQAFVFFEAFL